MEFIIPFPATLQEQPPEVLNLTFTTNKSNVLVTRPVGGDPQPKNVLKHNIKLTSSRDVDSKELNLTTHKCLMSKLRLAWLDRMRSFSYPNCKTQFCAPFKSNFIGSKLRPLQCYSESNYRNYHRSLHYFTKEIFWCHCCITTTLSNLLRTVIIDYIGGCETNRLHDEVRILWKGLVVGYYQLAKCNGVSPNSQTIITIRITSLFWLW